LVLAKTSCTRRPTSQNPLRAEINFFNQINVICPVQSLLKNISVLQNRNRAYIRSIPPHQKGRIMIVAKRGVGCGER
jgi:hypothetical protein